MPPTKRTAIQKATEPEGMRRRVEATQRNVATRKLHL
jgi:hypothetical protein